MSQSRNVVVPDILLGQERGLTATEISVYSIDCGPGGNFKADFYYSTKHELDPYCFFIRSFAADKDGLYWLKIEKRKESVVAD